MAAAESIMAAADASIVGAAGTRQSPSERLQPKCAGALAQPHVARPVKLARPAKLAKAAVYGADGANTAHASSSAAVAEADMAELAG